MHFLLSRGWGCRQTWGSFQRIWQVSYEVAKQDPQEIPSWSSKLCKPYQVFQKEGRSHKNIEVYQERFLAWPVMMDPLDGHP